MNNAEHLGSAEKWDEFCGWCARFLNDPEFDSVQEYKRDIAKYFVKAKEALQAGESSSSWKDELDKAFQHKEINHFIRWSYIKDNKNRKGFLYWVEDNEAKGREALEVIWDCEGNLVDRITKFCSQIAGVIPRPGTSLSLASVLLLACEVDENPLFAWERFTNCYKLVGRSEFPTDSESDIYEYASDFLDTLIRECNERGIEVKNRLEARGLVWSIWDMHKKGGKLMNDSKEGQPPPHPLEKLAEELYLNGEFLEEIGTLLENRGQVILQGPPGTGKTFVARRLAAYLTGAEDRVSVVQFHPSYAYEDFVEGYRPALIEGQPGFKLQAGPLKRAAAAAAKEPDAKHILIIDEINRGNVAKILGELYYLLEYRDDEMHLQYSKQAFSLPENLWIIGTMNTADRSIALVDSALRRRFYFVDFYPDEPPISDVLPKWLKDNKPELMWLAGVVEKANELLGDRDYAIGPSHFIAMGNNLDEPWIKRIWEHSILPHVRELLFGEHDRIDEFQLDRLREISSSTNDDSKPDSSSEDQPEE
ncbi:McrB family protein [Candidatus Poriferisocius sp.]|uniref:McrB family protein n=1 Tax=Candidatus Poriferisocius sp. TaxID=3101276 RepID=UPI003B02AA3F